MKIGDILKGEHIIPELGATDKKGALSELCQFLQEKGEIREIAGLYDSLWDRERLGSTGIGDEIAIPHAKTSDIPQIIMVFARSTQGIDFESLDQKPVHYICLLLAPLESTSQHMKALARIARLFKNPGFREEILKAPDINAIFNAFLKEDAKYN